MRYFMKTTVLTNCILSEESVQDFANTEEAMNILDSSEASGGTWSAGGCLIFAKAMKEAFGAEIYCIQKGGIPQHYISKLPDGSFVDAFYQNFDLEEWQKSEHISNCSIEKYDGDESEDIPDDAEAVSKLVEKFRSLKLSAK